MTLRQVVKTKVTRALVVAVALMLALGAIFTFWPNATWAWVGIFLMLGSMGAFLYIVWLVDCPKCHFQFGQRHAFNVAFGLPAFGGSKNCPSCGVDLDTPLLGP